MNSRVEVPSKLQKMEQAWQRRKRKYIEGKRCDKTDLRDANSTVAPGHVTAVKKQDRKNMVVLLRILASGICLTALLNGISKRFGSELVTEIFTGQSSGERYLAQPETSTNTVDEPQAGIASISGTTAALPRPRVALTFDDGPHPVYTKKLLDGLKERGIHATFFVVGENISGNEELIRRMADEGHVIGNHTYDHVKLSGIADAKACEEVQKTDALVRELTGSGTEFVRPPFGSWKKALECEMEMIPVLWDVDPLDWTTKNTSTVVQRVLGDVEPGDIVLLHDFYESSVDAALQIADELLAQGYEFVTVDEMILL